jgi:hypothetical protein
LPRAGRGNRHASSQSWLAAVNIEGGVPTATLDNRRHDQLAFNNPRVPVMRMAPGPKAFSWERLDDEHSVWEDVSPWTH